MILGLDLYLSLPQVKSILATKAIKGNVHFCAMLPIQVKGLLDTNPKIVDNIKTLIIGGASVGFQLEERLLATKSTIYETFGMTETISHVAMRKIGERNFKCLPDIDVSVEHGTLSINAPKMSHKKIESNDVVEIIGSNQFRFIGRKDNVINSGGLKIYPEIVEKAYAKLIGNEIIAFAQKDEELGQRLVLLIESDHEISLLQPSDLTKYEIPKQFLFIKEFERSPSGKILRRQTIEKAANKNYSSPL